jgi:hypothetical protein
MRVLIRPSSPTPTRQGVGAWRIARLCAGGFSRQLAEQITRDGRYDLHALLELADRGCPAELSVRILAPLEDEDGE